MQTNRDRFLESLIHREHTVLGFELQPFCLWHMIHLSRVNSPFLRSVVGRPSVVELLLAVGICASTPETPVQDMHIHLPPAWSDRCDLDRELEKFACYRRDYAAQFRRWDGKGAPLQVPGNWPSSHG